MTNERITRARGANPLIGKFFISFSDERIDLRGQVLAEISNGHFLVQLHDATGKFGEERVYHVAAMRGWKLFSNRDEYLRASGGAR